MVKKQHLKQDSIWKAWAAKALQQRPQRQLQMFEPWPSNTSLSAETKWLFHESAGPAADSPDVEILKTVAASKHYGELLRLQRQQQQQPTVETMRDQWLQHSLQSLPSLQWVVQILKQADPQQPPPQQLPQKPWSDTEPDTKPDTELVIDETLHDTLKL